MGYFGGGGGGRGGGRGGAGGVSTFLQESEIILPAR